jgi:hypothetical protein
MGTKVKILNEQLDKVIYDMLSEETLLAEGSDITKSDVEQIAKKTIQNYLSANRNPELESRVKSVVKDMVKQDKDFEKAVVEITRNVLVQLYKALWTRRSFWTADLKNQSS